jgi:hypothetical protein
LAVGATVGASACAGSGFQYVKNDELGVYAKLPEGWAVYDERELLTTVGQFEADDPALDRATDQLWFRGFDSSDKPSLKDVLELGGDDPVGFVQVQPLGRDQREQVNVAALRGMLNGGVDPVGAMREQPNGDTTVVVDEATSFTGGYNGVHTVFAKAAGASTSIIDETVVLNPTSSELFIFAVACDLRCYTDTHRDEIVDIVDSWTIQEAGQ